MPDLHFTTRIEGSPGTIFAVIADLAHYDRWLPGSNAFGSITEIAPLPVGRGTTYLDAGPAGTRQGEVTEFLPPTRIDFHQPMKVQQFLITGGIDIRLAHTLTAEGQATQLDRDLAFRLSGPVRMARPIVAAQFRKENERMLAALKRYVEGELSGKA